jgi:transcriptional regulator with XRE-family HTH domain
MAIGVLTTKPFINIRIMLARHGVTQGELAEKLGITKSAITKKLDGVLYWKLPELLIMKEIFGLTIDELVSDTPIV